ncbi:MAG: Gfo/Idh/MocA family oxidoreductase [Acidobacteria bacterium]|nr:Gfo/Idh/MocA family oxidoreductase [Acidobacteriota bacterium]
MRYVLLLFAFAGLAAAEIKVGIIGTDTSHVIAFTRILNDPASPDHAPGARIVAAYKGGSKDVESSHTRVDKYADELRDKWKLEIVPTIAALCPKVDAILLESVDGRAHLPQFREAVKCGKPTFIDKPLASTLEDAREIAKIAKAANVKWFSTSSLRYSDVCLNLKSPDNKGVITWGPGPTEPHHYLDLSWYGIHPVEMLFTLMGTGCEEVTRTAAKDMDETTCRWKDGRMGTVRTLRPYGEYGAVVFREKQVLQSAPKMRVNYGPMLKEIVKFFENGVPPVPNELTLEIFAFMDAAQRSKESGGKPQKLR